ncbi:hypothetical protein B5G36_03220 [Ligilactobacillus salivarius]|uniref:Uncharacterized protein n=1 Tax=Ligilactobacillus salivarius TaxID=1624 RepID=A0AB36MII5_9LACO|nr:hypothetical protein B5G36_03220 [Ligilactobacillus salivarius]
MKYYNAKIKNYLHNIKMITIFMQLKYQLRDFLIGYLEVSSGWILITVIFSDKPLTITLGTFEGMLMIYLTLYILFALLKILIHQVI